MTDPYYVRITVNNNGSHQLGNLDDMCHLFRDIANKLPERLRIVTCVPIIIGIN